MCVNGLKCHRDQEQRDNSSPPAEPGPWEGGQGGPAGPRSSTAERGAQPGKDRCGSPGHVAPAVDTDLGPERPIWDPQQQRQVGAEANLPATDVQ